MGAYENQLRHVAEPASPSERDQAVSATIEDYQALWFTEVLREFAHYGDTEDNQAGVAVAYASFIDKKVRDEGEAYVTLYAHTKTAATTLMEALYYDISGEQDDTPMVVVTSLEDAFRDVFVHYIDRAEERAV